MVKVLALSGGGARGSFQLGAVTALYEVYGFRPDVISGTSVGSVNAIMLAQAPPPARNDAASILANVAAGGNDPGIGVLRRLQAEWDTFLSPADFFAVQPACRGTLIEGAVNGISAPPDGKPTMVSQITTKIDLATGFIAAPPINLVGGPIVADELQKLRKAIVAVLTENAIANLDPVALRLNDPTKLDLPTLAAGTPVFFSLVSLESGRLRYVDGTGAFTERDGRTPVVTALMNADVDAALDQNLQPLASDRAQRIKDVIARHRTVIARIGALRAEIDLGSTPDPQRLRAIREIPRLKERGDYLAQGIRNLITDLRITARVDPRRAVLASAAIPVYFDPIVIGAERYIDGGVREILPAEILSQRGVTELVCVSCSTIALRETDELTNAGLPAVGLRALTDTALHEIVGGDIEAAITDLPSAVVINPDVDIHATVEVVPSLIEISTDYGWMRACDELHPVTVAAERGDFRSLSTLVSRLRKDSWIDEWIAHEHSGFSSASEARGPLERMRLRAWAIRELQARRTSLGLPPHPRATRWSTAWSRDFRPSSPFGTSSIWSRHSAWSANGVEVRVADEIADPAAYAPDRGALVDAGNDRVYWVVRGAIFQAPSETETTTARDPVVVVPHGVPAWLPKVPRGRHLVAEQGAPGAVWVVGAGRRYPATPELVSAAGLTDAPVATLPPGGLAQIPVGQGTAWLGRLAVTDNQRRILDAWGPTPQETGSVTSTNIGFSNFTGGPIMITAIEFTTDQDGPGSSVLALAAPLPIVVQGQSFMWVPARFAPRADGPITGTIRVMCDDPLTGTIDTAIATSATPIGPLGRLEVAPATVDFGAARVGQQLGMNVTLMNAGDRMLHFESIAVVPPATGFAVPAVLPGSLAPGQSATVWVSCVPNTPGHIEAVLAIDTLSQSQVLRDHRRRVEMPLVVTAGAPRAFLADSPLAPLRPIDRPPIPPISRIPGVLDARHPRLVVEVQRLDFGAAASGTEVRRTFWVRNTGDLPLRVAGVTTMSAGAFGIPDGSGFPATVPVGGELAIEANFLAPPVAGMPAAGELWVESDDPIRPRAVLTVVGRAVGARLTVPSELVDFGMGAPPASQSLTLRSDGSDPINVLKAGIVDDAAFTVSGLPALPATLAPGATLTLQLSCAGAPGDHRGRLVIAHDAGLSGESVIHLRAIVL
jgi:NTE family protein